jgi:16S rRNA (guanine966-N2)-methyltransferase
LRIIRGIYKTRRFSAPKGFPSRPTTDFAKEGIFNVFENQIDPVDLNVLDLCAGTGNISMEFLSREYGSVTSVDSHPKCIAWMFKVKEEMNIGSEWIISKADVLHFTDRHKLSYDLIFADPPYDKKFHATLVENIRKKNLLKAGGMCVIEHGKQTNLTQEIGFVNTRNFGNVHFSFFTF